METISDADNADDLALHVDISFIARSQQQEAFFSP